MTDGAAPTDGVAAVEDVENERQHDVLVDVVAGENTDDVEKPEEGDVGDDSVDEPTGDEDVGETLDEGSAEPEEKKEEEDDGEEMEEDIVATNMRDVEKAEEREEPATGTPPPTDPSPTNTGDPPTDTDPEPFSIVMHVDDEEEDTVQETDKLLSAQDPEDPEGTLEQLKDDMQRLDEQEVDAAISGRYQRNRFIFLAQSCLLGISYSIIWPTLWLYMKEFTSLSDPVKKLLYGITFVAYPMASILSAHLVERTALSTKTIILTLGFAEITGNIVFALPYHPSLLVVGRLIAGLGDAFYVILMRDMKSKHGYTNNRNMTMECLAAFITGVVVSPGINLITTLIPFQLLTWKVNAHNYPGLSAAVLFIIMELTVLLCLPSQKEKEISLRSHSSNSSSASSSSKEGTPRDAAPRSNLKVVFVSVYSFVYTYIVSYFELTVPIIVYEQCKLPPSGAMILYALLGVLYALILMFGMTISLRNQLEVSIGVTVLFKTGAFLAVLYLGYDKSWVNILCLAVVLVTLAVLWSHDDILFINLVRSMLSSEQREWVHSLRKNISKVAFAVAAVSVPFLFGTEMHMFVVPVLLVLVYGYFCVFVVIRCVEYNAKTV